MELLKNRPLAIICISAILIMAVSSYFNTTLFAVLMGLMLALLIAAIVLTVVFYKKREPVGVKISICAIIFILVSTILSVRGFDFYYLKQASVSDAIGNEIRIEGEVLNEGYKRQFAERLYVKIYEIDGKKVNVRAVLDVEGSSELEKSDVFSLTGTPLNLEKEEKYLISDGNSIKIICEDVESINITAQAEGDIFSWFDELNGNIQARIYEFTNTESGALVGALTLGNRDELEEGITRDFRRCGISHLLALSGLHIAIIIGFFDFILGKLDIDKRIRCVLLIALGLAYLALTGLSMSASRAVLMIAIVYVAHLLWEESDSITSLFLVTAVILALSPYALSDISLWMSVIATLGIIVISEIVSPLGYKIKKRPWWVQVLYKLLSAVSCTLAAIFFLLIFSWLCFGEISLVAPLTNLVITPIVTVILVLGMVFILVSFISPLASVVGVVLNYLCGIVMWVCAEVSDWRGIMLSLKYDFVAYIVIPFVAALIVFLIIYVKRKWTIALLPSVAVVAFAVCFSMHTIQNFGVTKVEYIKSSTSEMLILTNNEMTSVCDISTGGYMHMYDAIKTAQDKCATEIENVILTHYHSYHINTIYRISQKYTVRNVLLPEPENADDEEIYKGIISALKGTNTEAVTYRRGYPIDIGEDHSINVSEEYYIKRSTHPMIFVSVKSNEKSNANELLYFSEPIFENSDADYPTLPNYMIVGSHGPKIHNTPSLELIEAAHPRLLIFSDGEKMLADENTVKKLEAMKVAFGTEIVFDREQYEIILKNIGD